jgi:hypothetical protein
MLEIKDSEDSDQFIPFLSVCITHYPIHFLHSSSLLSLMFTELLADHLSLLEHNCLIPQILIAQKSGIAKILYQ